MASPDQVAAMAQQIKSVVKRDGWTSDQSVAPSMQQILGKLTTLKVDVDLLKQTNIGAMVRKLTKHDDEIVRGYSTSLMNKWMQQVGVKDAKVKEEAARNSSNNSNNNSRTSYGGGGGAADSSTSTADADAQRLEQARKRLQGSYASEKAKRDSRTLQVINRPMTKGKKGVTISAAPSRSSVAQNRLMQQRRTVTPPRTSTVRAASAPAGSRSSSSSDPAARRAIMMPGATRPSASSGGVLSREEQHRIRQQKLRALREKNLRENGSLNDVYYTDPGRSSGGGSGSGSGQRASGGGASSSRAGAKSAGSSGASRSTSDNRIVPEPPINDRKAFLDKMFPRVCGVAGAPPPTKSGAKKSPTNRGGATTSTGGGAKKKNVAYNESQREVVEWLKGLEVDMSEYAPAFFENGFDSIKLLGNIEKEDLPGLIPKKGHHRLIQQALDDLKRKHRTAASSRPQSARRDRPMPKRRNPYSDEDSDDSFVVSDGDEYTPGVISGMFRKNRKRSYSFDSVDSYNMEASFDEIQHEEERSTRYGEYEDYREELRNKKLLKKKK